MNDLEMHGWELGPGMEPPPCVVDIRDEYVFIMHESMEKCFLEFPVRSVEQVLITETPLHLVILQSV